MKLHISRHQEDTGRIYNGSKSILFQLSCQIELTPEEIQLVSHYGLEKKELTSPSDCQRYKLKLTTLASLIEGIQYSDFILYEIRSKEEAIRDMCKGFKFELDSLASFTGEETLEF
jgi:hypothetical protein